MGLAVTVESYLSHMISWYSYCVGSTYSAEDVAFCAQMAFQVRRLSIERSINPLHSLLDDSRNLLLAKIGQTTRSRSISHFSKLKSKATSSRWWTKWVANAVTTRKTSSNGATMRSGSAVCSKMSSRPLNRQPPKFVPCAMRLATAMSGRTSSTKRSES